MKIAVVGAGAMGSLFGARLKEAGEDVVLVDVSQAHIETVNREGLRLQADDGDRRVRLPAGRADAFSDPVDLVVVFTKAAYTAEAVASVTHLVGPDTWALSVQNGIGNVETIAERIPAARILFGMTNYPADLRGPGHVASHGSGEIRLWVAGGAGEREGGARLEAVCGALTRAGLPAVADPEVRVAIWEKVAFNAATSPVAAVTRLRVGPIGDSPAGREIARAAVDEVAASALANGVRIEADRVMAALDHAFADHRGHQPSMLQDVLAGRRTEIGTINGAVIAAARAKGVPCPVNETLYRLVSLVETNYGAT